MAGHQNVHVIQLDDFISDQLRFLSKTHIAPDSDFKEFVLTEGRPGRARLNFFEETNFEKLKLDL